MDLLYTTNTDGAGAVFAERDHAESVARLHAAFRTATTWGELRAGLTPEEYAGVLFNSELDTEDVDPGDPFDADADVPGYADGFYPAWLQAITLRWFPHELVARFGQVLDTPNGDAVEFPPERADEIAEQLRALGHTVTRSDLYFF